MQFWSVAKMSMNQVYIPLIRQMMPYDNDCKYTQPIMVIGIHLNFYLNCINFSTFHKVHVPRAWGSKGAFKYPPKEKLKSCIFAQHLK